MKQFARSVPAILVTSAATLSMIALAGCGSSSKGNGVGSTAAKNVYVIQTSYNETTGVGQDSVAVFSASSTGDATPTSTLMLPAHFYGDALAIGPNGEIYVGGDQYDPDTDNTNGEILEYTAGASGSVMPIVTLNGSDTSFEDPDALAVNSAGTLFVSSSDGSLEAFASGFTASSTPSQYLTWGMDNLEATGADIGVDTAGDLFYVDEINSRIYVYAAGATGPTAPVRTITGTDTASFSDVWEIAVDGAGDLYVVNYNDSEDPDPNPLVQPGTYAANKRAHTNGSGREMARPHTPDDTEEHTGIIEFAAGASSTETGNPTPTKRIGGSATNIVEPEGLLVDAASNLYYADAVNWYADTYPPMLLEVFRSSATGNVAPAASITSLGITYDNYEAIAIH